MSRLPGAVFLSHSSEDKTFVHRISDDLQQRGFEVWLDAHDLYGGDALPKRIAEGIAKSSAMVVVISDSALASEHFCLAVCAPAVVRSARGPSSRQRCLDVFVLFALTMSEREVENHLSWT